AFDDDRVIAGQGTIGLELLEQHADLTAVVVPIGGGGLISGIAIAIKEQRPSVRIFGVEAAAAPSALASRTAEHIVKLESADTLADGIAVKRVGERTFPLIERYVDDIVSVGEDEIAMAIHLLLEHEKVLAEGAGAVPLAALVADKVPIAKHDVVAMVLSGGNIDVNMVERIIARGLVIDGRLAMLAITVPDRPGNLARARLRRHLGARRGDRDAARDPRAGARARGRSRARAPRLRRTPAMNGLRESIPLSTTSLQSDSRFHEEHDDTRQHERYEVRQYAWRRSR